MDRDFSFSNRKIVELSRILYFFPFPSKDGTSSDEIGNQYPILWKSIANLSISLFQADYCVIERSTCNLKWA